MTQELLSLRSLIQLLRVAAYPWQPILRNNTYLNIVFVLVE